MRIGLPCLMDYCQGKKDPANHSTTLAWAEVKRQMWFYPNIINGSIEVTGQIIRSVVFKYRKRTPEGLKKWSKCWTLMDKVK